MNAELYRMWLDRESASIGAALAATDPGDRRERRHRQRQLDTLSLRTASVECDMSFRYVLCLVHEMNPCDDRHAKLLDWYVREALAGVHGVDNI